MRHPMAILGAATLATLLLSWSWRARCLGFLWNGRQYELRCYNDVQPLFTGRGLSEGQMPYVEAFSEYPVVTGMFQYAVARLTEGVAEFYSLTAFLLGAVAVAVTWITLQDRGPRPRLFLWALGPPLFLYAFHNWDLLAVGLSTAAFVLHGRDRPGAAGAVMALAGLAKVYPLLFLPLLGIDLLRRERGLGPKGWRFGVAAVGTLVLVNLPFWIADAGLWWQTYTFHTGRSPNLESIWFVLRLFAEATGADGIVRFLSGPWVDGTMALAIAGGLAAFGVAVGCGADVRLACLGMLLVFLLPSKVFSVQYALWVTPFLALVDVPARRVASFFAADLLVFWTVWPVFGGGEDALVPFAVAVVLRFLALAALLGWVVQTIRVAGGAPRRAQEAVEAGGAHGTSSRHAGPSRGREGRDDGTDPDAPRDAQDNGPQPSSSNVHRDAWPSASGCTPALRTGRVQPPSHTS